MIKVLFEIYKVLGRIGIKPKDIAGMGGDIVKMGKSLYNTRPNPQINCNLSKKLEKFRLKSLKISNFTQER